MRRAAAAKCSRREGSPGEAVPAADRHAVVALVDDLLGRALAVGASDIHFEPTDDPQAGLLVRVRLDGLLHDFEELPGSMAESVIARLKVLGGLLTYRIDIPQEGGLRFEAGATDAEPAVRSPRPSTFSPLHSTELRLATFPTIRGERAVVRVFNARSGAERLDDLGFEPAQVQRLRSAVEAPSGMIVLTGPAGAGKTTTLYALIRHIRDGCPGRSIITVEDPVEQRIDRVTQIQIAPHGELNYEVCMRSLLRQDPQVLLIGEIRDARTVAVAIEAALTGHLILTTMHSGDPAEAILRLLEMGVPPYQVVSAATLVCTQRLLCRRADDSVLGPKSSALRCRGRIACGQVVVLDEQLRELILRHPTASQLRSAMRSQQPGLRAAAARLAAAGVTDAEEVRRVLGEVRHGDPPGNRQ